MDIQSMSIEEKVGQLFIVRFDGNEINGELINLITTYKVGGIYYKDNNFKNPRQVHKLSSSIQRYANKDLPLFIATDQLGGSSNVITTGVTLSPSHQKLGQINNRLYTKQIAEIIAHELQAMGINLNFSPQLNLLKNNDNSFGENIDFTSKQGLAAVQGSHKANVVAAAKMDDYLTAIGSDFFESSSLHPYITNLRDELDSIVISDTLYNEFINQYPTSSHLFMEDYTAYNPIVISDTQEMDVPLEIDLSILSGADIILMNNSYENQCKEIDRIIHLVKRGTISEKRLDRSVKKILALKAKRNIGELETFKPEVFKRKRSVTFSEKLKHYVS